MNRKTDKLAKRWAVWTLAVVLALQSVLPAVAQEESVASDAVAAQETQSSAQTESSTTESSQTVGAENFQPVPTLPMPIVPTWQPGQDPDEANEPLPWWATGGSPQDDDVTNTPPPTAVGDPSQEGTAGTNAPNAPATPTPPPAPPLPTGSGQTLNTTQWWQGLIPASGSGSGSSQTAQGILDLWQRVWTPVEDKTITTPSAGSGQTTGGVTSPASTSTSGTVSPQTASTTPLSECTGVACNAPTGGAEDLSSAATTTPTSTDIANATNSNNSGEGSFINQDTVVTDVGIENTSIADVTHREVVASDSGNNTLEFGQRGEGGITTGNAATEAQGEFDLNTTQVRETGELPSSNTGCADCWAVWNLGSTAVNEGTGEDSLNQATADVDRDFTVVNTNLAYLGENFFISGNSGRNRVNAGWSFKDGWIETGAVNVHSNIINKVNTNLVDIPGGPRALWRPFVLDIRGNYAEDIDLFDLIAAQFGGTRGVKASATNANTGEDSLDLTAASFEEDISITNNNTGLIENDFMQEGVSGQNNIFAGVKVKRTKLKTGKVQSAFNLFNFLNTNIVGGEATVVALNIFGNFSGNILIPDFSKIFPAVGPRIRTGAEASGLITGAEGDSINQAIAIATSDTEITVQKFGGVASDIRNRAISGDNENIFGDEVEGINVKTGKAKAQTNVDTTANLTCIGCGLFTASFNILGDWLGQATGLPTGAKKQGNGKSFVVTVDDAMVPGVGGVGVEAQAVIDGAADDSFNGSVAVAKRSLKINNQSEGAIINKVDALGDSGSNTIAALDGKDLTVDTGDVASAVNVSSLINTDVIGGKLVKIAVNLFGTWNGNFVVGEQTDLSVSLSAVPSPNPAVEGGTITYTLTVHNAADGKATNATVIATFDSAKTTLVDAGGGTASNGAITFTFTDLQPGASVSAQYKVKINSLLGTGTHTLPASAMVSASRGDSNQANDQASAPVTVNVGSSGNSQNDGNNNNGEGTVGGAILPGSGSGAGGTNNTGGTNIGNATSGGGNGSTNTGEVWTITKSNSAPTAGVAAGSTVPYKIVLKNNRANPVNDVKVYDKLKNAQGIVVFEDSWDLGVVAPNEKVVIDYTVIFSKEAPDGIYKNTAYASGFDIVNQVQKSGNATSQMRINSAAPVFVGTVEGQPSGAPSGNGSTAVGGAAGSTTASPGNNESLATRESWTPVDSSEATNPATAGGESFALADYTAPQVKGYDTVQKATGDVIRRVTVPTASAAGLNPALFSGLVNTTNINRDVPFGGSLAGADTASQAAFLMARTILFGLLSLFCFLTALLFARRRKDEKVHSTPYWML